MFDYKELTGEDNPLSNPFSDEELSNYVSDLFSDLDNRKFNNLEKKEEYCDLLLRYLRPFHLTLEDDYSEYVPKDFLISDDLDKKIEILNDCLSNSVPIIDSSLYQELRYGEDVEINKKGM